MNDVGRSLSSAASTDMPDIWDAPSFQAYEGAALFGLGKALPGLRGPRTVDGA